MRGPLSFADALKDAREVIFGYLVMFERDWEWALGGKSPGACTSFVSFRLPLDSNGLQRILTVMLTVCL